MANGNQGAIAGLLGGIAGTMPGITKALATRREREGMSDLQKLQKMANPRDIADIEALAELLPQLAAADREKAIEKVKKRIGFESYPLLDYYVKRAGQAPAPGIETWQEGAAGRTRLQQLIGGTQPGFEPELRMGQLPEEARLGEWARRAGRAEPFYPGITEVGRGMIPTGAEGVLPPPEAARQRAREAGAWPGVTAITGAWTPQMLAEEKEETITQAQAKGLLDKYGVAAAKTFIDKTKPPSWVEKIEESQYPQFGLKKENGVVVNDLSKNEVEAYSQLNLRIIFAQEWPTLDKLKGMPNLERMRIATYGTEMLSPAQMDAIKRETSALPQWLIDFAHEPLTSKVPFSPDWFQTIKKLLRYFTPQEVGAMLGMATDQTIRQGIVAEVGFAK